MRKLESGIIKGIVAPIVVVSAVGLSALFLNPKINPNPPLTEIIEENNFVKYYNLALEEFSREEYNSGQDKEFSSLKINKGEIPGRINNRYVAFSENKPSARYLDNGTEVSTDDLINFVKAYSSNTKQ